MLRIEELHFAFAVLDRRSQQVQGLGALKFLDEVALHSNFRRFEIQQQQCTKN